MCCEGLSSDPLSQKTGRCDAAPKGRCTTPTHIYSICIGFKLIRPKSRDKFRIEHWKKSLGLAKCCVDLSSDTSHSQRTNRRRPSREGANSSPYIFNMYRFQIDPTKTLRQVQHTKTWSVVGVCTHAHTHKFRPLSQKTERCDAAPKERCTTPTHIYSICIGFRLIRPKLQDKFRIEHWKKITRISKMHRWNFIWHFFEYSFCYIIRSSCFYMIDIWK